MSDWSLRRRLWAAFAVIALLSTVAIAMATIAVVRLRSEQRYVTRQIYASYTASNDFLVAMLNQETSVRGYATVGQDSFLEPYRTGQVDAVNARARLLAAESARGAPPAELTRVLSAANSWSRDFAVPAVDRTRRLGPGSVTDEQMDLGREAFDKVRVSQRQLQQSLLASRTAAERRLDRNTSLLIIVVAAGALGLIAVGALLWLALSRWVTRPLEHLGREVSTVAERDPDHEVQVRGPPEFVALGTVVEGMRQRVVAGYKEALAAQAEAELARSELAAQAADLQRSNAELEQFAYLASHDLQEPLRKVASFTRMLQQRYQGQLDDRADTYIEFAVDGAKRMQQLINDLLALSRVGRGTSGFDEVDLEDALDSALRSLQSRVEESGARVRCDPLPTVLGEASLLAQLFQNLLGNAMKFSDEGPPQINVGVRRDGGLWEISVTDQGIGIEPKYAERIFVIFQRLHPKDEYEGTGIGLALCRKIVEFHGGHIWLDTETATGTTFRLTLPVLEARDDG